MAKIRFENVTKTFSQRSQPLHANVHDGVEEESSQQSESSRIVHALDRVSLTIPNGETLAVVGPSGCGKSTLLRIVAGLESEYSGHVYYDEQRMEDVPAKDRHVGMVFQNYALYPHFEGEGNLSFFFRLRKISDEETNERIRITSEIMGIGFNQLLRRKPGTLSGGQQQRVAIARAIVRNPRIFLFDEPLSNLDAKLRTQTRIEIKRLLRRFQITAIYVTHDQVEAIALADQIAVMRNGRIEQMGHYQKLSQYPSTLFVAGFLGNPPMNLFTGGVVAEGEIQLGSTTVALPDALKGRLQAGQSVDLSARPESAHLITGEQPLPNGLRLRGEVEVIEPDFSRQTRLVYMRSGSFSYAVVCDLNTPMQMGNEVDVVFPDDRLTIFDGISERRIS